MVAASCVAWVLWLVTTTAVIAEKIEADTYLHRECCNILDQSASLIECVNETLSTELLTRASGGRPDLVAVPAGRPHIVLVTRATENVYSYASLSLFLQASYAAVHNYTLYPLVPDTAEVDYRYYRKLAPLLQVLRECSQWAPRPCDYVVWMDAGAY
jgi:hypothetical protein